MIGVYRYGWSEGGRDYTLTCEEYTDRPATLTNLHRVAGYFVREGDTVEDGTTDEGRDYVTIVDASLIPTYHVAAA